MFWWWYFFETTDESYEYSDEPDENEINTTIFTTSFKTILSETDDNFLFYTFNNNIVFGGQLTAEYIKEEICDYIIKMLQIYEHL